MAKTKKVKKAKKAARRLKSASARHPVGAIEKADVAATEIASDYREAPAVRMAAWLAEAADQPPMLVASAATIAGGLGARDPRLTRAGVRMGLSVLFAMAAKTLVKRLVDRTRPHLLVEEGRYRLRRGTGTEDGEENSFPSGHTADAVAATRAVARDFPGLAVAGGLFAGTVAAVQIPRCQHFVSDIAAGALIGWGAEMAAEELTRRVLPE